MSWANWSRYNCRQKIWAAGAGEGPKLTVKNGMLLLKKGANRAWFPVQKGVSQWMGKTKVHRKDTFLITEEQIKSFEPLLLPGDILLERREWYMTNIGIPGFWTHVALYIGSAQQRATFFDDPQVIDWVKKKRAPDFEALLKKTYPQTYDLCMALTPDGRLPRVIEALADGVVFTSLEHSAACDSLAVLRPRLTKKEKAIAVLQAMQYSQRPYDYDFDFLTDSRLVCTELVYKAFEPGTETTGLTLPLENLMGHWIMPANAFARQFDEHFGSARQQMELVLFLDGDEREGKARTGTRALFRRSWTRPKWHILRVKPSPRASN